MKACRLGRIQLMGTQKEVSRFEQSTEIQEQLEQEQSFCFAKEKQEVYLLVAAEVASFSNLKNDFPNRLSLKKWQFALVYFDN
jgi:hypothetical protein